MPTNPFDSVYGTPRDNGLDPEDQASRGDALLRFMDFDPEAYARRKIAAAGMPSSIGRSGSLRADILSRIKAPERGNPYNLGTGNLARDGQVSALDQLYDGTSTVAGQASRAMGQLSNQVSGAAAGGGGLAQAMAARVGALGGSEVAGQAGAARLAEYMKQQQTAGQGYGSLRDQDLGQASAFNNAGVDARALDDRLVQFYSEMGNDLQGREQQMAIDAFKLQGQTARAKDAQNWNNAKATAEAFATVTKMFGGV